MQINGFAKTSNSKESCEESWPFPPFQLGEPKKQQKAKRDETTHNDTISPLPRRYPVNHRIDPRHLARSQVDPSVDAGQRLPLEDEVVVHGVRLAERTVRHVVAVLDTVTLVEHVFRLLGFGVVGAVLVNVGAHVGQEVGSVAGLLQGAA